MKRILAAAIVLTGLGLADSGHAANIKVWLYGDGESGRMHSELKFLVPSSITVARKEPMESTGTGGLWLRVYSDLASTAQSSWPNVIHIGYNASAGSYINCAKHAHDGTDYHTDYLNVAWQEAVDIRDAADIATSAGRQVLLSKGPGVPNGADVACVRDAFNAVTWYLALIAGSYPWVDYSGYTAGAGTGGVIDNALKLVPSEPWHWEDDRVHVSCDAARYLVPGASCEPFTDRTQLGAWRAAKTVLKAYQSFQ